MTYGTVYGGPSRSRGRLSVAHWKGERGVATMLPSNHLSGLQTARMRDHDGLHSAHRCVERLCQASGSP